MPASNPSMLRCWWTIRRWSAGSTRWEPRAARWPVLSDARRIGNMRLSLIAALVLSSLVAVFAVQNSQPTHVTFMGWYSDGPLVIVLLLTYAAGTLSAILATLPVSLLKSVEISKLKARLADGARKIESLEKTAGIAAQANGQKSADENSPRP